MRDTRGKESITLRFVAVSWAVVTVKFAAAGLTLPVVGAIPEMEVGAYGLAVAGILAIWLGREWTEKVKNRVG